MTSSKHLVGNIEQIQLDRLKPFKRNARTHPRKQVAQIAASIAEFGFNNPILVSDDLEIIAGHGRVLAANTLGLDMVPVVRLSHLSDTQRRAYVIADNKSALNAGWDTSLLAGELKELEGLNIDLSLTGFSTAELDILFTGALEADIAGPDDDENVIPPLADVAVTRPGDIWLLGNHRIICGDARDPDVYAPLLEGVNANLILTDPPFNLPIEEYVTGPRGVQHSGFQTANGQLSSDEFQAFLTETLTLGGQCCVPGAIVFVFMDWRHIAEITEAGKRAFHKAMNVIVWNKTNAGMGGFYRSKHELIFVFKACPGRHQNNFNLGENGRYRTNVWDYAGVASFGGNDNQRLQDLALHPTVKPVSLMEDAIKDVTRRGDIVLDLFGGAGTTLIAAEKVGRRARLIEIDPKYVDVTLRRFRQLTGREPVLEHSQQEFSEVEVAAVGDAARG